MNERHGDWHLVSQILCNKDISYTCAQHVGGKKKSNFSALFRAKYISFRRCNQEKGNEGSIENDFFHLSANLGHILDLSYYYIYSELKSEMWPRLAER